MVFGMSTFSQRAATAHLSPGQTGSHCFCLNATARHSTKGKVVVVFQVTEFDKGS